jgi:hypothetical protein
MFWSELIRYVALAGQIAFAAGIAAMITITSQIRDRLMFSRRSPSGPPR